MKILLIDFDAALLDFALRAMEQGHEVRHFMQTSDSKGPNRVGDGLVKKVREWEPSMPWADLVVMGPNNVKHMGALENYRKRGFPIFGPSRETASWENSRKKGQAILSRAGIPVADALPFTSYRDAAAHVAKTGKRYVAKPDGDVDKALSYVAKGTEDLRYMLEYWHKTQRRGAEFILQEFIPGMEFAVGGFFGPQGWCGPWLENFEHKKLMAGDVGPNTLEMGTILKYVEYSELAEQVLRPLEGELYRSGHTGYIDVSVIIDRRGRPWPLEFTSRFGHPLWMIQQALHPNIADWMRDLVDGKDTFNPKTDVAVGLVQAIRDWPYCTRPRVEAEGFPIFGWDRPSLQKHIHPDSVMMGEALGQPCWVSAGPMVLTVTGTGETIREATDAAHGHLSDIILPNSPMHRVDIGRDKIRDKLKSLQELGFAEEWRHG